LPSSLRPFAHRPDFVRLLEPILIGNSNSLRRYPSMNKICIGEWKYSTDNYLSHTAQLILNKYAPLANALQHRWLSNGVDILPVVICRTGTPHIRYYEQGIRGSKLAIDAVFSGLFGILVSRIPMSLYAVLRRSPSISTWRG
jgi:hypothetical protein